VNLQRDVEARIRSRRAQHDLQRGAKQLLKSVLQREQEGGYETCNYSQAPDQRPELGFNANVAKCPQVHKRPLQSGPSPMYKHGFAVGKIVSLMCPRS
jgi:hypothetical protein